MVPFFYLIYLIADIVNIGGLFVLFSLTGHLACEALLSRCGVFVMRRVSVIELPSLSSSVATMLEVMVKTSILLTSYALQILFTESSTRLISAPLISIFFPYVESTREKHF